MKKSIRVVLVALCIWTSTNGSHAQWVQTSGPAGGSVACFASSGGNMFAGTLGHGIFLSTNNGSTWTAVNSGLTNDSVYVLVVSGSNLFAATLGGVFLSTNNGTSWTAVNNGLANKTVDGLGFSGTNLFAGTAAGVFLSTNSGASWTGVNNGLTNTMIVSLTTTSTSVVVGTTNGVYLTTNYGASWIPVNAGLTNKVVNALAVSGTNIFAGTYGETSGGVFLSTNNGSSWTLVNNGLTNTNLNALVFSGTNLFAGTDGGVFLSTNNGTSWTSVSTGLSSSPVWGLAVAGTNLFAGTTGGAWRRPLSDMISAPPTWVSQSSPLGTQSLGQIQFVNSTEGWIVASNGKLPHTTNSGSSWSIVSPGGTDTLEFNTDNLSSLSPLSFVSPTTGWVMGTSGSLQYAAGAVLFKTTNGGATWSRQPFAEWSTGFGVQFVDATHGWAEVVNGTSTNFTYSILRTTDGGNQWTSIYTSNSALCFPYFIDASNGWAIIGSTGTFSIVRTTDGGTTWNSQFSDNTPGGANRIQFVDATNGWVVGDSSKIFHTTNGGSTWMSVTNSGVYRSSRLKALYFLDGNTGWIGGQVESGGIPAFVLHTTNGGASWSTQGGASWSPPNTSPVHSNIVGLFFVDANTGWMTTHFGDLVKTTTGGEITAVYEDHTPPIPNRWELEQNYPNPFNPSTTIRYQISQAAHVTLKVYNTLGAEVATLVSEHQNAGSYQVQWNPKLPSGVYFYSISAGSWSETKKLLLLK